MSLSSQLKYSRTRVMSLLQQTYPPRLKQDSPGMSDLPKDLLGSSSCLGTGKSPSLKIPYSGQILWPLVVGCPDHVRKVTSQHAGGDRSPLL